jgi:hypothetical protein
VLRAGADPLRVRVLELGEGGALLEGETGPAAGEEVTVRIERSGAGETLELVGRIERWAPASPGDDAVHRGGVSFTPIGPGSGAALRDLLDRVRRAGVE